MSQAMVVQNKAGASGAEGLLDIQNTPGDAHRMVVSSSGLYTVPLATGLPFNWRDLTPVAMVAQDEFIMWVNSDTPYKTPADYLAEVKKTPTKFKMGGTSPSARPIPAHGGKSGIKFIFIRTRAAARRPPSCRASISTNTNNPSESVAQWRPASNAQFPVC
jgi:tripartite-type tricarboxylate transporter receptor subunit TctC